MNKKFVTYTGIWIFLITVTFFVSYLMNVVRVAGGGLFVNWSNVFLSLIIVSIVYLILVWKKLKR